MAFARGSFLARLTGFFALLRREGIPVGIGAELDLARALAHVAVTDRDSFRDSCRATLAKSPEDVALLDRTFDRYWEGSPERDLEVPEPDAFTRPPADGNAPPPSDRPTPMTMDAAGVISFATYSPDAPPGGHALDPLPPNRVSALRTGARRFRRYASTRPGRRRRAARHGTIDLRATARAGVARGGEWIELRRQTRREHRADLLVLWDVSGSMREHDRTLFALAHALRRVSRQCRVFAFGSRLADLTPRLEGQPYARAGRAVASSLPSTGGGTRIGPCLREFRLRFGSAVTPRSTVVLLSDGWDLGDSAQLGRELSWLRRRAHRLVWVNPYARSTDFRPETAGMKAALPHVDLLLAPEDFEERRAGFGI